MQVRVLLLVPLSGVFESLYASTTGSTSSSSLEQKCNTIRVSFNPKSDYEAYPTRDLDRDREPSALRFEFPSQTQSPTQRTVLSVEVCKKPRTRLV